MAPNGHFDGLFGLTWPKITQNGRNEGGGAIKPLSGSCNRNSGWGGPKGGRKCAEVILRAPIATLYVMIEMKKMCVKTRQLCFS